jgi:hypothetical protein
MFNLNLEDTDDSGVLRERKNMAKQTIIDVFMQSLDDCN